MPMTPPRTLWHVEWNAARSEDRPHQRVERTRTFRSEWTAARQIVSVRKWEPSHTELIGVWRVVGFEDARGVQWERLDDAALDALVDVLLASDDLQYPNQEEPQ